MNRKIFFGRSLKDLLIAIGPSTLIFLVALAVAYKYLDPAPPDHFTITTGEDEGDYQLYAKQYKELLKEEGVTLDIKASSGPMENLKILEDESADVDAGFVQDGIGSPDKQPDLVSLGSLYYEPIWVFYRGQEEITKFTQFKGKRVAIGYPGRGTRVLAQNLLNESGIDEKNTNYVDIGSDAAIKALKAGEIDAAFFLVTPDDQMIDTLISDPTLHLMNVEQAEAISRQIPFFHHLVLPRGALDIKKDLPHQDVNLVSPTATLLVRDDLHPALAFLLLKAAAKVHSVPGILERRGEFPTNQDDSFPLSSDAKQFYKSGGPIWQRYLPFWIAAWVDRFIFLVIPIMALVFPLVKIIPQIYRWRILSRIYQRYGELKFLETQIGTGSSIDEVAPFLHKLDDIEERVNKMKVPLEFSEHFYSLRGHIQFVRDRLTKRK
jgi:TRAP transporter TAXI family solute receptor